MGKIYKGLLGGEISVAVMDTTDIVNDAIRLHNLSPLCAAGLGRALTATAYMASNGNPFPKDSSCFSIPIAK